MVISCVLRNENTVTELHPAVQRLAFSINPFLFGFQRPHLGFILSCVANGHTAGKPKSRDHSERKVSQQVDPEAKLSETMFPFTATRGLLKERFGALTVLLFPSPSELSVAFKNFQRGSSSSSLPSSVNKHLKNSHQNHEVSFIFRSLQTGKQS